MIPMKHILLSILTAGLLLSCSRGPSPLAEDSVVVGVGYVGITVSDLDRSETLYRDATDLKQMSETVISDNAAFDSLAGRSGVTVKSRLLRTANAQLRLMEFQDRSPEAIATGAVPVEGTGIAHICFQADQEMKVYERFLEGGATAIGDPAMVQLSPRNPVYYAYVNDFDGAVIEVEHVDIPALKLDAPPKNQYRLRHVAFASPDVDRLAEFYSAFLDQPKPRRVGGKKGFAGEKIDKVSGLPGSKIRMAWFKTRNLEIEISQYVSHPTTVPAAPRPLDAAGHNMIVFEVTDLDEAREKFVSSGGVIVTEIEEMDGGQVLFGRDPDGNLIGLQTVPADAAVSASHFPDNGI